MQLHQLRYVVAVAEEGHFTRAAAKLHVAQPSVSNSIRALERELGTPLFHRSRAAVTPTSAGEAFLPWARQALVDCEGGRAAVRELIGLRRGRLSLGATPSLTTNLLPPVLADFHRRYPGVELALHEAGSGDLVLGLEHGRLDLALVILPVTHSWVQTTPLINEELVLAVHPEHPLASRTAITVAELKEEPLVLLREGYDLRQTTIAACRRAGFEPILALEGGEMDGVVALTAAGLGAAVLPATVVRPDGPLRAIRFSEGGLSRTIGMAARRDRPLAQAALAFVRQLQEQLVTAPDAALHPV